MTEEQIQPMFELIGLLTDAWAILPPEEWDSGLDPADAAIRDMVALGHDLHHVAQAHSRVLRLVVALELHEWSDSMSEEELTARRAAAQDRLDDAIERRRRDLGIPGPGNAGQ